MASESDQDLPRELLEKLRNLELELEDGDITQKGFEKKKASLLQQYRQDDLDCNKTEANSKEEGPESGQQHDFGPEPSAADVVDFLDYLPSPTHSPPKPETGAALMEQNHNNQRSLQTQAQIQTQSSQSQMYPQHGSHYSTAQSSVSQVQYQGYPQQQQWQQPYRPNMQGSRPDPQYYPVATASPRPTRPYDPRAVPRQPYQTGGGQLQPSPSIRHQYPYGYPAQQQVPPQSSMYRSGAPPPAPAQGHVQYRPMYTTSSPRPAPVAQHPQQSPRPVYRTGTSVMHQQQSRPMNPYVGGGYRPAPAAAPAHVRTSSLDAVHYSNARPYQHGTPRPAPQNIQGYRSIPPEGWRG